MANLADLRAQVTLDLRRSNLANEVRTAILDAIRDHGAERFYFNETEIYTFNTIADQDVYSIVPQAPILEFVKVDWLRAQVGNSWYYVKRESMDRIEENYSTPSTGQPSEFAVHGNEIRIWPMPNQVYPLRMSGHYREIELSLDSDSNDWTNAAKNLIRYSALKRLYMYPVRDAQQMQMAEAGELRELDYLRRETNRRARRGVMQAYY